MIAINDLHNKMDNTVQLLCSYIECHKITKIPSLALCIGLGHKIIQNVSEPVETDAYEWNSSNFIIGGISEALTSPSPLRNAFSIQREWFGPIPFR